MEKNYLHKNVLNELYIDKKLSQTKIANLLNVSQTTVKKYLMKYGINFTFEQTKPKKIFCLTKLQQEAMDGCLLGDGSILENKTGNSCFSYQTSVMEHTQFVFNYFKEFATETYLNGSKKFSRFDKRTEKTYYSFLFRTQNNVLFTKIRRKWYNENGVKNIPRDLKLTPLSCLIWYIGDGSLINRKRNNSQHIKLCTNSFKEEDIEKILIPQLKAFNAHIIYNEKKQPMIKISKDYILGFLRFIGDCPISLNPMSYKWLYKEKVKNYKKNIYKHLEKKIINLFTSSQMTYYGVAKYFNVAPGVVRHYLKQNNINTIKHHAIHT